MVVYTLHYIAKSKAKSKRDTIATSSSLEHDQPLNAIHYTDNLQIGYELLEVRSSHGLKPIYHTGYTPKGTIEAMKAEAREVLSTCEGIWRRLSELGRYVLGNVQ